MELMFYNDIIFIHFLNIKHYKKMKLNACGQLFEENCLRKVKKILCINALT